MAGQIGAILNETLPPLDDARPDLPLDIVHVIELMLVKDREARIQSIRQVGAALEAISKSHSADRVETDNYTDQVRRLLDDRTFDAALKRGAVHDNRPGHRLRHISC